MKVFERSKSTTRSTTPRRVLSQKPPFPKLIQKRAKPSPVERNKENIGFEMILPQDALLIKPNEIVNQSLYTQSPLGESHICFPYELPGKPRIIHKPLGKMQNISNEIPGVFASTPTVIRNNRVKLLSKNFKINRNAMTGYCKGLSLNSTPEPKDFE